MNEREEADTQMLEVKHGKQYQVVFIMKGGYWCNYGCSSNKLKQAEQTKAYGENYNSQKGLEYAILEIETTARFIKR